jgi:hypothetical protein
MNNLSLKINEYQSTSHFLNTGIHDVLIYIGEQSPVLSDISSRIDILKGQLKVVETSRLDPTMLSKAYDLIIVEGNVIHNLEGTTFYINSSEHLIQASSANKMSVKERVVPYESKTLQVSIN